MVYLGISLLIILIGGIILVPIVRNWLKAKRDTAAAHQIVHEDKGRYAFLIDSHFRVKDTNFYELNPELNDGQPEVLGNVLHCKNGCDSGLCGTGIACQTCPVRMILKNSFHLRRNFEGVESTMKFYDKNHEEREVDVTVDGQLFYLGYKPHFIVNVKML